MSLFRLASYYRVELIDLSKITYVGHPYPDCSGEPYTYSFPIFVGIKVRIYFDGGESACNGRKRLIDAWGKSLPPNNLFEFNGGKENQTIDLSKLAHIYPIENNHYYDDPYFFSVFVGTKVTAYFHYEKSATDERDRLVEAWKKSSTNKP